MTDESKPTHLDLFSGIGGFSLAAEWAGFETIGFAEIDPYASAVLRKHWPGVPNYGDVRTVPAIRCDLITGGFPCQPFSCAGKRRGKEDDRYLWPAMLDVIRRCGPAWVLGENVAGLIDMELDGCFADLEGAGYEVQPFVIPACAVDARHRRDRVWIVAHRSGDVFGGVLREAGCGAGGAQQRANIDGKSTREGENGPTCEIVEDARSGRRESSSDGRSGAVKTATCSNASGPGCDTSFMADTPECSERAGLCAGEPGEERCGRSGDGGGADVSHGIEQRLERVEQGGAKARAINRSGDGRDWCEWPVEPDVGRVAHGVSARVDRLKCLGNAIVPQVAYEILKAIRQLI